jgi:hypothetical protein
MNPFDYVNAINKGTDVFADPENEELVEKGYNAFMTNKALSYFVDTILYAQEMNCAYSLSSKQQFAYYLSSVKPRKRFSKWAKAEKDDDIALVQQSYQVGRKRAKVILTLLSKEQLDYIKSKNNKGE